MHRATRHNHKRPDMYMVRAARRRAKASGIECTITAEDITIPKRCPLLGLRLKRRDKDCAPTLDRIDPAKGYIPGNVWVISMKANRIKNDATLEELEQLVFSLRAHDLMVHHKEEKSERTSVAVQRRRPAASAEDIPAIPEGS